MREIISAPSASVLVESMRDIGYSLETAIADIVDNSITAEANRIDIFGDFLDSGPAIAIIDNGRGMSAAELRDAMRLGSQSPLDERPPTDLGRFGLGLKTSSFSQCRKLTVVSRQNGVTAGATWDLDRVAKTDDWTLQLFGDTSDIPWFDELTPNGTLVLWEDLDRIVGTLEGANAEETFAQRLSSASDHLSLVFHRFLKPESGREKIAVLVNYRELQPVDPFYSNHSQTRRLPSEPESFEYNGKKVLIQGFTLPHYSKLSKTDWEENEGPSGYLRSQGFYVYRERRLIIWGTWFNLFKASELTKLARVRIDITNDQDADWKIDVRKASAQPPPQVRRRLRELVERLTNVSRERTKRTPRTMTSVSRVSLWERTLQDDQFRYLINHEHPLINDFTCALPTDVVDAWVKITTLLSTSLPLDTIFGDMSANPKDSAQTVLPERELEQLTRMMVSTLMAGGMDEDAILANLQYSEPFKSNWTQTKRYVNRYFKDMRR